MRWIVPAALMILALAPAAAGSSQESPGADATAPAKPSLRLKASTRHGYAPLTLTLSGELQGADPGDLNSCLLSEEFVGEKFQTVIAPNTKRTIPCVTVLDDGKVPRAFSREITLKEPGTYSYRILLTPKGRRQTASASVEIRAIRPGLGIGAAVTGPVKP